MLDRFVLGAVGRTVGAVDLARPLVAGWHYVNIGHQLSFAYLHFVAVPIPLLLVS